MNIDIMQVKIRGQVFWSMHRIINIDALNIEYYNYMPSILPIAHDKIRLITR